MIVDTFMYRGEKDLLEFRLHELEGRVAHHVLIEATQTHRGDPKPLFYPEHRDYFAKWERNITHIVVDDFPPASPAHDPREAAWVREHLQRDSARAFLDDFCTHDDIVLISDLDEIPSDEALAWDGQGAVALLQRTFHSAVDWEYPEPQFTSVLARAGMVSLRGLAATRDGRYGYPVIREGGWHFSWLGAAQDRKHKLKLTCHLEMPKAEWDAIESGATYAFGAHYAPDANVRNVVVDSSWPRWIYERKCPESWFRP